MPAGNDVIQERIDLALDAFAWHSARNRNKSVGFRACGL